MKAGVVSLHTCNKVYDCFDCKFDKAMTKAMGKKATQKTASNWAEYFKKKFSGDQRPCRHVVTGRIQQAKICTHNYECHNCEFDQMLDDVEMSEAQSKPGYITASGFKLAQDYYYHDGHTWVRIEHGGMARIGFDDFSMKLFGKAEFIPEHMSIGSYMERGVPGWSITQENKNAKVLSPISGTILSVNQRVRENPGIMHDDPYQDGWLFVVEPDAPLKSIRKLKFGEESVKWLENESKQLMDMMGPEYSNLAATGGEPVKDFYGLNPEIGWDRLVAAFLKT
jgi:glycine cleavage system H lipoate-binding protein